MEKLQIKRWTQSVLLTSCLAMAGGALAGDTPYTVEDGKVDVKTWVGMKIYQRGECQNCHGPDAKGGAAFPSLLDALKTMSKEELTKIVKEGQNTMPPKMEVVMGIKMIKKKKYSEDDAMEALYAYLKGRSDGAFKAKVKKIKKK